MERILRSLAMCVMAVLPMMYATPTAATTYGWGNVIPAPPLPGVTVFTTAEAADGEVTHEPGVSFLDYFTFDLIDPFTPGPAVSVLFELDNLTGNQAIPLTVELAAFGAGTYVPVIADGPATSVSFTVALATSTTAFQQYRIAVSGIAPIDGTAGYSGVLTVTAVPEPSAAVLLLAGLALLATVPAITRRHSRGSVAMR